MPNDIQTGSTSPVADTGRTSFADQADVIPLPPSPGRQLKKLSVVIPARDEAGCIASTVEHLHLELTLQGIHHEIVVVDDGSRDAGALERLERVRSGDTRIKVAVQPNAGPSAARNRAVALSTGRYLCLLDSDDSGADFEILATPEPGR
jgi:glycosyltransferase involved in cell wall biosynthesis